MTPETILETVRQAGGALWVDGETLRYRMPKRLSPLVSAIRERKPELLDLLSERPAMPVGVRLISWEPKAAPVQISRCETATDVTRFAVSTIAQIDARLHDRRWLAGNWPLSELLARLAAVGCVVELEDRKAMLQ
jgi:hypothetical protein